MFESLLLIVVLVSSVALLTVLYKRQPLKPLTQVKPSFVFFPKYLAGYQRNDADVELTIGQLGFIRNELTGLYYRGTVRSGLNTKSIKLTISMDREKKEIAVYSSFFGVLFDNGDIWQLTHDVVNGLELKQDKTQEMIDLFDRKKQKTWKH